MIPKPLECDPIRQVVSSSSDMQNSNRLRRLHRKWASHTLISAANAAAMFTRCISTITRRLRRAGVCGLSQEIAFPELRVEKDTIGGVLRYGPVPVAGRDDGLQAQGTLDHGPILESLLAPSYPAKDHSTCRWQPAYLRDRPLFPGGRHRQRSLDRPGALELFTRARTGRLASGP
ncbi:UNVERIFIED_CONTAM: hypothetical protein GTU68_049522 [Idotea baltica]|nr:hypothetical protein [Idotea baltica]